MKWHRLAFILFFTSQFTVLNNHFCALDSTFRILNTCYSPAAGPVKDAYSTSNITADVRWDIPTIHTMVFSHVYTDKYTLYIIHLKSPAGV